MLRDQSEGPSKSTYLKRLSTLATLANAVNDDSLRRLAGSDPRKHLGWYVCKSRASLTASGRPGVEANPEKVGKA